MNNKYLALWNAISKSNTSMGIKASNIAKETIKTGREHGVHYLNIGMAVIAFSNDKAILKPNHNRACSVARQQTAHLRNGASYGVPNGVSAIYNNFDEFVSINNIPFANENYKNNYAKKLQGQYYFIIGQGVSNNFHEILNKDYTITNNLENKRDIWGR